MLIVCTFYNFLFKNNKRINQNTTVDCRTAASEQNDMNNIFRKNAAIFYRSGMWWNRWVGFEIRLFCLIKITDQVMYWAKKGFSKSFLSKRNLPACIIDNISWSQCVKQVGPECVQDRWISVSAASSTRCQAICMSYGTIVVWTNPPAEAFDGRSKIAVQNLCERGEEPENIYHTQETRMGRCG